MKPERKAIWNKSEGKCWYCGTELNEKNWHVDHFEPINRVGGEIMNPERDTFENKVPACPSCNIMKTNMNIESFRWLIGNFVKRLNRDVTVYRHAKRYGLVEETGKEVTFWFEENEEVKNEGD